MTIELALWSFYDFSLSLLKNNLSDFRILLHHFLNHWWSLQSDWLLSVRFIHESHHLCFRSHLFPSQWDWKTKQTGSGCVLCAQVAFNLYLQFLNGQNLPFKIEEISHGMNLHWLRQHWVQEMTYWIMKKPSVYSGIHSLLSKQLSIQATPTELKPFEG